MTASQGPVCPSNSVSLHPLTWPWLAGISAILILSAALTVSGWRFWISLPLGSCLLALGLIDWHRQRLPDSLTLPLIAAGLAFAFLQGPDVFIDHLTAAAVGWLGVAALAIGYRRLRGRSGIGGGDAKLLAAAGAWLGLQQLPATVLLAAVLALVMAGGIAVRERRIDGRTRLAFGPFLAIAFWICWLTSA